MKTLFAALFAVMIGLTFAGSTFADEKMKGSESKTTETKTESKTETKNDGKKAKSSKKTTKTEEKKEEKK
jgi:hypothetical protein